MAWKLKACPRCNGDTYIFKGDYNIWYEQCLQCGYEGELKELNINLKKAPQPKEAVERDTIIAAG